MTGPGPLHPGPGSASGGSPGGAPIPAQTAEDVRPRCSNHDIELVVVRTDPVRTWDCPIAALHDLAEQFRQVYEANYGPAPAGENGCYHRAMEILAGAHSDGDAYCSPECLDVNGGPCDTDGGGPCLDAQYDGRDDG